MTDEANPPEDPAIARKKALIADGASRNPPIKLDMRWGEQRMLDALGATGPVPAPVPEVAASAPQPAVDPAMLAELESLRRRNAELEAARAAPEPAPQPYNAPKGMLTTMQLAGTGALLKEEEERRLHLNRGEIHGGQVTHRELPVSHGAKDDDRQDDQRRGDRTANEDL